jgi:hypothetical protein
VITDNQGARVDDVVAVYRLVVARDLRFPDDTPGDRLGRLLAEVGELADTILTIEQGTPFPLANPGDVLAEALVDVMCGAGCIAHHYQLAVRLPPTQGYVRANNSYVLLGLLTQAGGALAQIVVDQMLVRPNKSAEAGHGSDELALAVDLVLLRTLVLAEHYGLRHELRCVIQNSYRTHQDDGFLPMTLPEVVHDGTFCASSCAPRSRPTSSAPPACQRKVQDAEKTRPIGVGRYPRPHEQIGACRASAGRHRPASAWPVLDLQSFARGAACVTRLRNISELPTFQHPRSQQGRRMSPTPNSRAAFKPKEVAVAVGSELRLARLDLNWTRQHAVDRVPGITAKSLDNNESGIRMCGLVTLVQLSRSMAVPAPDLLELAMQRMPLDVEMITLHVDLPAVALDPWPPRSLRRWATDLWHRGSHRHGVVRVPPHTIAWLAHSTNTQPRFLINYLAGKGPHSIRGSKTVAIRVEPDPTPPPSMVLTKQTFSRALGVELRTLRTNRSWSNADVTLQLRRPISASSWYGYERDTVQCSIPRLIELGQLFNTPAPVLLRRTLRQLGPATPAPCIGAEPSTASTARGSSLEIVVDGGRSPIPTRGDRP